MSPDRTQPPTHAASRRILVIRPDRIGDVVLVTPMLRALRRRFPSAYLAAMIRPYAEAVLDDNPHLDALLLDDPEGADAGASGFFRTLERLRRLRFDTALMPLPRSRYAWLCFLAGIHTRIATGRKLYNRLTFTRSIRRRNGDTPRHEADYCLDLVRAIGVDPAGLQTETFLRDEERHQAAEFLGPGRFVGIHPGSGHSAPNWPATLYGELARSVLDTFPDVRLVLTGGAADLGLRQAFAHLPADRVIDILGTPSLRWTMAVISRLDVLVSASTGPMHLAAALRVPTVSLFCPLPACAPALWGPQGNVAEVVLPTPGYCQERCPGDPHVCDFVGGIDPRAVAAAIARALATPPASMAPATKEAPTGGRPVQ